MKLNITNLQKKIPLAKRKIKRQIKQILLLQNKTNVSLSIVFVNDKTIRKINQEFLRKNLPTDVLAFNLSNRKNSKKSIDGEIIISLETAARNAKIYKKPLKYETMLYLAHGILHLCGFDDKTDKQAKRMHKREEFILKRII